MAITYNFSVNIVMVITITINKTLAIHDSVIDAASTFNFAVNIVMVINITISQTFVIHDSVKKIMLQYF